MKWLKVKWLSDILVRLLKPVGLLVAFGAAIVFWIICLSDESGDKKKEVKKEAKGDNTKRFGKFLSFIGFGGALIGILMVFGTVGRDDYYLMELGVNCPLKETAKMVALDYAVAIVGITICFIGMFLAEKKND